MAGRTRSASVSISAVLAAICSRIPCISAVSACPSDRRIVSSLFSACSRQASTCSPSFSCFSSLCSSLAAPGAATTPGSRKSADQVRLGLYAEFLAQPLHGLHVGLDQVVIDFHCAGPARLVVNVHVHMAAPQPVSNRLPDARFEHFKPIRHAQVQIQEPVVHAAQVDAHGAIRRARRAPARSRSSNKFR